MLEKYNKIHIIGIGGISLSALALILKEIGKIVTGTDRHLSKITDQLAKKGIQIKKDFCQKFVEQADLVVYTSAISESDEDFCYAKKLFKSTISRAELLGEIAKEYYTISVAGSHGKTTATAMIGYMFQCAKKSPTVHVGGIMKNFHSNVLIGKSNYFITEACEYKDSFLHLNNNIAIILNESPDHLDYFKNQENYFKSFQKFAQNVKENGVLIINNDDCFITNLNGAIVIHDYAHHPDEIISSIRTCKQLNKKRLITIFQPHTFTRTRDLYYQFCDAFNQSDEVWLLPIYPAREKPLPKITSLFLAKGIKSKNKFVRYFSNFDKCFKFINKIADNDCLFLILGAGDVEELANMFKKR